MFRMISTLSLLAAIGCGGGDSKPSSAENKDAVYTPAGHDSLVIAYQSDLKYLISVVGEASADADIVGNISFPLIDSAFDCSLKKKPGIATSWEWSDDGKVLSMTLRDDIQFQDGKKVTPEDIKFTFDLVADPAVSSPRISYIQRMVEGARPKIIDNTHIEWHFTEAYDRDTQSSHTASLAILPKHRLVNADRATLRGNELARKPLATGPWKLAKHEPEQRIILEPNEMFSGPAEYRPKLKRVIFRILPEYNTRLLELEAGNVDLMQSINVADADKLRENHPEIKLYRRGWRTMDYIAWNLHNPLFQDVRVRRALTMSINMDAMISKLLTSSTGERYARRSVGTITPALCGVHNDNIVPLPFNLDKAKALFAEAGWADTDGDGVLDKDGKPFEFTLVTNTGNKRRADAQILAQANLKAIGVKVHLSKEESNSFFENLRKKDFEAALSGWSAGLFVDPTTMWHSDTAERKYEFNFTSYSSTKADELMERGMRTADPRMAAPIWKELQQVIYDDQPYTFLWWMDEIVAVDGRFENVKVDILSPINNLYQWEVKPENVKYKR